MSTISNLGNRSWPSLYGANQGKDNKTNGTNNGGALQKTQGGSQVSQSTDSLLQQRVSSVGSATVDFAQNFVNSFAQSLFGDDGKGATISFDSASLDVSSSFAAGMQHTEDANGVTDAAAMSLTDNSHFIGKGTITTADGRKFDFEVEIQYSDEIDAAASQTQSAPSTDQTSDQPQASNKDLPTAKVPNVDFAGTMADLFKLIGQELKTTLGGNGGNGSNGNNDNSQQVSNSAASPSPLRALTLRLLNLIDSKDTNTYAPLGANPTKPTTDTPAATDTSGTVAAPAPAAPAPAAAAPAAAAPSSSDQPSA